MTTDLIVDQIEGWDRELRALTDRLGGLFTRPEPRRTFADLVRGLLADVPRKNSWQLAEYAGHARAYSMEWLLNGAKWDADRLRDEVRSYVVEELGSDRAVLVVDDTQSVKKGTASVGIARQHCGLTGQVENCQCMVMVTYASAHGHAFVDRELYLPESWTGDVDRMAAAGVPPGRGFATKQQLAVDMLDRALAATVPFGWVAADADYGRNPTLRAFCHDHQLPYVMAVPVDLALTAPPSVVRADGVLALVDPDRWERRSCGDGAKGQRYYDWAAVAVTVKDQPPAPGMAHTLLLRRSVSKPDEIAFFLAHAPLDAPIPELIAVAGLRWKIEENNAQAKDLVGLDQYEVRKWTPWHRYVTCCMLALAFLAVSRARLGKPHPSPTTPQPPG